MPSTKTTTAASRPPWLAEHGVDLARVPIDSVLRQALSADAEQFRSGCSLLAAMSHAGRVEAGVFLLGLLRHYPDDYPRLTMIAEALASFPTAATVAALAAELRRDRGGADSGTGVRSTGGHAFPPAPAGADL